MRGEFLPVWPESWDAIWLPLSHAEEAPPDIFCELYRELANAFEAPLTIEKLADIIDDPTQSKNAFERARNARFSSEAAVVGFFESAYSVLDELQGSELAEQYYNLLSNFIEKYSLGYALQPPCLLSQTISGMFAELTRALKHQTISDGHVADLFHAHEEAIKDLRFGATEARMKMSLNRHFMLLEAIASKVEGVNARTLGDICDQVKSWPHATVRESLKKLYGFASDYPGIRHAGNPAGRLRVIEPGDLAALSIVLVGYSYYLRSPLATNLTAHTEES